MNTVFEFLGKNESLDNPVITNKFGVPEFTVANFLTSFDPDVSIKSISLSIEGEESSDITRFCTRLAKGAVNKITLECHEDIKKKYSKYIVTSWKITNARNFVICATLRDNVVDGYEDEEDVDDLDLCFNDEKEDYDVPALELSHIELEPEEEVPETIPKSLYITDHPDERTVILLDEQGNVLLEYKSLEAYAIIPSSFKIEKDAKGELTTEGQVAMRALTAQREAYRDCIETKERLVSIDTVTSHGCNFPIVVFRIEV